MCNDIGQSVQINTLYLDHYLREEIDSSEIKLRVQITLYATSMEHTAVRWLCLSANVTMDMSALY